MKTIVEDYSDFEQKYKEWMEWQIAQETNPRRRELLEKGLGHETVEFLRTVWYPAVHHFDDLFPEWEVKDFHNGYRYLNLAYMPGGAKGGIEIQGYASHAGDIDVRRFKDICWQHCLLSLDGWILLPIAYPSIKEEPWRCSQLVLSFVSTFVSQEVPSGLSVYEAEAVRFARRLLRPFAPNELAAHLMITERHTRRVLHKLVDEGLLLVVAGKQRYRTYILRTERPLFD